MADGLTGDYWVRVADSALRESQKRWPKARDRMEVRRHALKLRFWPEKCPTTEHGIVLDVNWEWIRALRDKKIAELKISDVIGGCDNIRIVFFVADKREQDPLPVIWILAAVQKTRDEWTKANLVTFDARRKLVLERYYGP